MLRTVGVVAWGTGMSCPCTSGREGRSSHLHFRSAFKKQKHADQETRWALPCATTLSRGWVHAFGSFKRPQLHDLGCRGLLGDSRRRERQWRLSHAELPLKSSAKQNTPGGVYAEIPSTIRIQDKVVLFPPIASDEGAGMYAHAFSSGGAAKSFLCEEVG